MKTYRILIVDDEPDLREILRFNLMAAGYDCEEAENADEALTKDIAYFDLLLLDVMMPGMTCFEMAKVLSDNPETAGIPIIFLTALDAEAHKLTGFELGADDYVAKPFSVRELQARIKAVLARSTQKEEDVPNVIAFEGLQMEFSEKRVIVDKEQVTFTPIEFALLWMLITHKDKVLSRHELLKLVWPKGVVVTERTVDVNITRIRKKIGPYANHIVTRSGFGYAFR